MTWFTSLCIAARYWLQIKAVEAYYDLQLRIERDVQSSEQDIDKLRKQGDPASQLAADRLRVRLVRAQGIASRLPEPPALPAAGAPAAGGEKPANG